MRTNIFAFMVVFALSSTPSIAKASWLVRVETQAGVIQSVNDRKNQRNSGDSLYIHDLECNGTTPSCTGVAQNKPLSVNINTYSSSTTDTSADSVVNPVINPLGLAPAFGYSQASANLSDGTIRIKTDLGSTNSYSEDVYATGSAFASANAIMTDGLHFDFSKTNDQFVDIGLDFRVDGSWDSGNQTNFYFGVSDLVQPLSGISVRYGGVAGSTNDGFQAVFSKVGNWTQFGPEHFVGSFRVAASRPDLLFSMQLATQGAPADFSHTVAFNWTIPSAVTFRSDSGVFMSAMSSGVPETQTWIMLICGFSAIGIACRARRSFKDTSLLKIAS